MSQIDLRKAKLFNVLTKNIVGLLTILLLAIACFYIVKIFKKPGQMTVIESQAMDMAAMVPPLGAVPVAMELVQKKVVQGSIIYTGTVQAFEDEDIYPRVTGKIVYLKVYPGDRVKKNELIVKLDPQISEYSAKFAEAKYEAEAEMHNTSIAKEQFQEKEYEYKAAVEEEAAARQVVTEAQASQDYWLPEQARQKKLYEKEVVSLAEYQLEESYCKAAMAKTLAAQNKLSAAINKRKAAQAAYNSMTHHVNHQYLLAQKAQAVELKAKIYDNYTSIHIKDDGVITKRLISPGVLVNPGMLILKVAYVNKVRVQCNVSDEDANKIKLGNPVFIKSSTSSKQIISGSITSIFPAADPNARTFIVEALINNINSNKTVTNNSINPVKTLKDYYFLPGQYVIMQIITGESTGLAIPTSSVIYSEGKTMVWQTRQVNSKNEPKQYSCLMHPEVISLTPGNCPKCGMELEQTKQSGQKTAHLVEIKTGLANPDLTQVTQGLNDGDEIITAGYENLIPGSLVLAAKWSNNGPESIPTPNKSTSSIKMPSMEMPSMEMP